MHHDIRVLSALKNDDALRDELARLWIILHSVLNSEQSKEPEPNRFGLLALRQSPDGSAWCISRL